MKKIDIIIAILAVLALLTVGQLMAKYPPFIINGQVASVVETGPVMPEQSYEHPAWFKQSFLDLGDDLKESQANNKKGIIVYFGQHNCPFCKRMIEANFSQPEIKKYITDNFDLIAIDINGVEEVTDPQGNTMTEEDFALSQEANFTPALLFYNSNGDVVMKLRGFYQADVFKMALQTAVKRITNKS